MKYHEYSQEKVTSPEFCRVQKIAKEIYEYMCAPDISKKIREVHKINARSHEIQNIILPKCEDLGLASERKGLFSNYALRPDYYVQINGSGLILEVERGKTIANNMDLVDIWKCHICEEADYLFNGSDRIKRQYCHN